MKVLVFSDTHLKADFFEVERFVYLKRIINEADQVIINGDFWEGYLTTFDQFVNSPWKELFPFLKKKHTVYLFGNHDKQKFSDERVSFFSDKQALSHTLQVKDKTYLLEHGDRIAPLIDVYIPQSLQPFFTNLYDVLESSAIKLLGKTYYKLLHGVVNRRMKRQLKNELKENEIFVCGHTHNAEIDLKNQYVNSGVNKHGFAQHIWITDKDITLIQDRYK